MSLKGCVPRLTNKEPSSKEKNLIEIFSGGYKRSTFF